MSVARLSPEMEQFIADISPVEWFLRRCDDRRDAYWQHEIDTDANERRIMDELGYDQNQIIPLELPL